MSKYAEYKERRKRLGQEPFQILWTKEDREAFEQLVDSYDQGLSLTRALNKLVRYAIQENWLPGYEKKDFAPSAPLVNIDPNKRKIKSDQRIVASGDEE